jgi:hypothetical protein
MPIIFTIFGQKVVNKEALLERKKESIDPRWGEV